MIDCPQEPTQLVDRICNLFRKYLQRKKPSEFSLEDLISDKYKALSESKVEEAIQHASSKIKGGENEVLKQFTELKNPDGLTTAQQDR